MDSVAVLISDSHGCAVPLFWSISNEIWASGYRLHMHGRQCISDEMASCVKLHAALLHLHEGQAAFSILLGESAPAARSAKTSAWGSPAFG